MDISPPGRRTAAVVALKALPAAKSRLFALPAPLREHLARCMALDTITALAAVVDEVLVVSDQEDLPATLTRYGIVARVVGEPDGTATLNRALAHGDRLVRAAGAAVVLACVGDLPALRPATVQSVLAAGAGAERSFLPDQQDRGTTMLVARGGPLNPLYGTEIVDGERIGSAERHRRSGAVALHPDGMDGARRDVDTLADLAAASALGVGPATARLLDPRTGRLGRYLTVEVIDLTADGVVVAADGAVDVVVRQAYDGDPARIVPGRRLPAVRVGDALHCWS